MIATPAAAAQEVADLLVAAGIRSILNFAPAVLAVPPGVSVRKVDLAVELQILAFYEQRKATLAEVKRRGRARRADLEAAGYFEIVIQSTTKIARIITPEEDELHASLIQQGDLRHRSSRRTPPSLTAGSVPGRRAPPVRNSLRLRSARSSSGRMDANSDDRPDQEHVRVPGHAARSRSTATRSTSGPPPV